MMTTTAATTATTIPLLIAIMSIVMCCISPKHLAHYNKSKNADVKCTTGLVS